MVYMKNQHIFMKFSYYVLEWWKMASKYSANLNWLEYTTLINGWCNNIKTSFHGSRVSRNRRYLKSLRKMIPSNLYHLNYTTNTCAKCYYYKQIVKFVFMIWQHHISKSCCAVIRWRQTLSFANNRSIFKSCCVGSFNFKFISLWSTLHTF